MLSARISYLRDRSSDKHVDDVVRRRSDYVLIPNQPDGTWSCTLHASVLNAGGEEHRSNSPQFRARESCAPADKWVSRRLDAGKLSPLPSYSLAASQLTRFSLLCNRLSEITRA